MKNSEFTKLSRDDRQQKLTAAILERAKNMLTDEQVQALLDGIKLDIQYTILVYSDSFEFTGALSSRQNGDDGEIVFGKAEFARSLFRNCFVGILNSPKEPSAAVIRSGTGNRAQYTAHIYIPQTDGGRGNDQ